MKHEDLLKRMTLEEKASYCSGSDFWHTEAYDKYGLPSIMWTDGPHGIRKRADKKSGKEKSGLLGGVPAICFPTAATTACSWDPDLLYEMGTLLGEECLAEKVSVLLGPGINMKRSPLCGRNFEYFSEDPLLAGELAAAMINGVQSKGIGTSLKHYAVNNQETRRMTVNAVADERALREIYLTAYEIAVKKAQPWTVMCMYNRLNGTYGAENKWLLTDVLRHDFGFEGIVITDWGANNERVPGLLAGQNLEMPSSNGLGNSKIIDAVNHGDISEKELDESVDGVLDVIVKANQVLGEHSYDKEAHHKAARKIAGQCMVLLKNEDKMLPLDKKSHVAVIGQMAKKPRYQGAGSSIVNSVKVDNAFDTMTKEGINTVYADGYSMDPKNKKSTTSYINEAVKAAEQSEYVLVFAGLPDDYESEGFDRNNMRIPPEQVALIEAVSSVNRNTAVILAGGSSIEMPWEVNVKAILNTYLGGEASGSAATDIIFGDINPSGKLAETFPYSLNENPSFNYFPGHTATVEYRESVFIGYRYYDTAKKDVRYPFGFGLSYTTFEYSDIKLSAKKIKADGKLTVSFKVKNTGDYDGAEVAELYVKDDESVIFRPEKELKGFKKVFLKKGEEKEISIDLEKRAFAFYDTALKDWHVETGTFTIMVGSSSRDIKLTASVNVTSDTDAAIPDFRETAPCYYTGDIMNVPAAQFEAVLGCKLPPADNADYPNLSFSNTLEDSEKGRNGKKICGLLRKAVGDEGMACAVALQTPIKDFIAMSMGVFSEEMAQRLLDVLNDRQPITSGLLKLFFKAVPSVIQGLPKLTKSI